MNPVMLPTSDEVKEDELNRAIRLEWVVTFKYLKLHGNTMTRTFSPFEMGDGWVIGWDHGKDELRRFTLKKIAWPINHATDEEYIRPREKGN